jgi:hypothetical protein
MSWCAHCPATGDGAECGWCQSRRPQPKYLPRYDDDKPSLPPHVLRAAVWGAVAVLVVAVLIGMGIRHMVYGG